MGCIVTGNAVVVGSVIVHEPDNEGDKVAAKNLKFHTNECIFIEKNLECLEGHASENLRKLSAGKGLKPVKFRYAISPMPGNSPAAA